MNATRRQWTPIPQADVEEIDRVLDYTYLTQKQAQVLRYIAWHISRFMSPPTYREVAGYMGSHTQTGGFNHVKALIRKGKVAQTPTSKRLLILGVRVRLQRVGASMPLSASSAENKS